MSEIDNRRDEINHSIITVQWDWSLFIYILWEKMVRCTTNGVCVESWVKPAQCEPVPFSLGKCAVWSISKLSACFMWKGISWGYILPSTQWRPILMKKIGPLRPKCSCLEKLHFEKVLSFLTPYMKVNGLQKCPRHAKGCIVLILIAN